jgi:hypothetical protein
MKKSIFIIASAVIFTCTACYTGQTYSYFYLTGRNTVDAISIEKNSSPHQSYRESVNIDKIVTLDIYYKKTSKNIKEIIDEKSLNNNDYGFVYINYSNNSTDTFVMSKKGYVYYYSELSNSSYCSVTPVNWC